MSFNRAKLKVGLRQRTEESARTRDSDFGRSIFDDEKTKDITFFTITSGEHLLDILPYLTGKLDPYKQAGDSNYLVDLYVHKNIGPSEDSFICLWRTYGKPCPVCEHRDRLRRSSKEDNQDEIDALKPIRRTVYAVWDRDNETKGVQVWQIAYWFMEKHLKKLAKHPRRGGVIAFADPDTEEGRSIAFSAKIAPGTMQFDGYQFVERDEPIPDSILERVPTLDELLHIPTYEEVLRSFKGGVVENNPVPEEEEDFPRELDRPVKFKAENAPPEPDTCPFGGAFGVDFDLYEQCSECGVRIMCHDKQEPAEPAPPTAPPTAPPLRRKK